ncbi:MOSC domain-containing protein [Rubritalea spongiae]|uniref:MOSC domain-containing protein n=1 Tax=Rubritalea spongiae TaxID=430797 RepID=A0ABW5DXZ0_9BACT
MPTLPKILNLQIGKIETFQTPNCHSGAKKQWPSAINKRTITGPATLTKNGVEGDEHADKQVHGGFAKAICVYPSEHLAFWESELGLELHPGNFGENLTLQNQLESNVCIGDIFQMGDAKVQITQPRQPCWKLAKFHGIKELALKVQETGRTGWYLRVLESGTVHAGTRITLLDRPSPIWSIAAANQLMHHDKTDFSSIEKLLTECPDLSASWRKTFAARLTKQTPESTKNRLQFS